LKNFTYLDKYIGRSIHISNFKQSLLSFLDNGTYYLIGYIPTLIKKLQDLSDAVSQLPTFRFYASSLLILYDGGSIDDPTFEIDVRMIDFANCVTNADLLSEENAEKRIVVNCPPTTHGSDLGYLLGLKTLIKNFEEIHKELGGLTSSGHILKEKISKSTRATAEVGTATLTANLDLNEYGLVTSPLMTRKLEIDHDGFTALSLG
jgi:hypothetical protein